MLGFFDKFLTLWIFLSIFIGLALGIIFPNISNFWSIFEYQSINILLMLCLIAMMYPPLAKIRYQQIFKIFKNKKSLLLALILNWIIGPILMFALAIIFLHDKIEFMQGIILIGLARCVAMVAVWSDLAKGDREYTGALIALNSIFQILFFSSLAFIFLQLLPNYFGFTFDIKTSNISMQEIGKNVLIYLGIPFIMAIFSRIIFINTKGKQWYQEKFLPKISPITPITLIFTIIIMCSYHSNQIFEMPLNTLRIALPLIFYFILMFFISWYLCNKNKLSYPQACSICFSASGNNFELAIAISIGYYGIASPQAFATIIGPLIEVPVLILLVKWILKSYK